MLRTTVGRPPRWILALFVVCLTGFSNLHAEPVTVSIKPLRELQYFPELRAPANVLSLNSGILSAEISGRITEISALVGQTINQGDVLVRLDNSDLQLALNQARVAAEVIASRIDLAKYELQRARALSAKQAVSEQLLKQRETELNTLQAEYEGQQVAIAIARRNLTKTTLAAPYTALVSERLASLGELASPGTPLLRIIDTAQLEVSAAIQVGLADSITTASKLQLQANGVSYPLSLRTLTGTVNSRSRTREARLTFSAKKALPGSSGELVWKNHQAYLPADLLIKREGRIGVFLAKGDKAVFTALETQGEGRPVPVTLDPDALIIVQGRFNLQDGDAIEHQ